MIHHSIKGLTQLGAQTAMPQSPDEAILETIHRDENDTHDFLIRFSIPEFTSLCPMTGQPDFAHIVIDYVPDELLIESKALKLLMGSYRNHGAFHEACTVDIADRLCRALEPQWFRISAYWFPRGGIPIDVFWQTGSPPDYIYVPPIEIAVYRAR